MALPVIALAAVAAVVAGNLAYDYLFPDNSLPDVGDTTALPSSPPFTPPFLGGQCNTQYLVTIRYTIPRKDGTAPVIITGEGLVQGPLPPLSAPFVVQSGGFGSIRHQAPYNNISRDLSGNYDQLFNAPITEIASIARTDGLPDNCGNLGDPNPTLPPSIPSGGVPQNSTPAITPNDELVNAGLPVVFSPSALSALAGLAIALGNAIANAAAAADALQAIKATADAVDKLAKSLDAYKDIFEQLRKYLNKKEQEDDAKKRYLIRQYGTILRDGYLDITPRPAPIGFDPIMLDFLCSNIPNGLGRFFGNKSYNWFRYTELGTICFLSPTLGVLSVHKIEHVRTSIAIPELAVGFTYNMGLNGIIRARVSMLYTQEKPNPTP